jgi:surface polysaccharide O-acyltransferase-like enzyme
VDLSARRTLAPERVAAIEILRGPAIIAVIGLHTSFPSLLGTSAHSPQWWVAATIHLMTGFGVPLFIVLSAAGMCSSGRTIDGFGGDYRAFIRRRAVLLLPGYVFWSIVTVLWLAPSRLRSPSALASIFFAGTADAQFYFVPLIFQLYLLRPLLEIPARAVRRSAAAALVVVAGGILASAAWWKLAAAGLVPRTPFPLLVHWLIYVALGIALATQREQLRRLARQPWLPVVALLAVVAAVVAMAAGFSAAVGPSPDLFGLMIAVMIFRPPQTAYIFVTIAALFLLALRYEKSRGASALAVIGRHSYGIYLCHVLFLRLMGAAPLLAAKVPDAEPATFAAWTWIFHLAGTWLLCLVASLALVAAASRSSWLRPLVSARR